MWALGIISYELATKKLPFLVDTEQQLLNAITDSDPAEPPHEVSPLIKGIIKLLLDKNPEKRPNATQILKIPEVEEAAIKLRNQVRDIDPELAQKIFEEPTEFQ